MVATKLMTAAELLALAEDKSHCELIAGERIDVTPAGTPQGIVFADLNLELAAYLLEHPIGKIWAGEAGFLLERDPDTVLSPELAIVTIEQRQTLGRRERGFTRLVPPLVIEIKSPDDREAEITRKLSIYLRVGVAETWWFRPDDESLSVHWQDRSPMIFRSPETFSGSIILPGFVLDLGALFA